MDYVGPIKGRYLLVKIDYLSKMVELDVCLQVDTKHTIARVEKWERSRGLVEMVIIDGGRHFVNKDVKGWMSHRGVKHIKLCLTIIEGMGQ